MASQTPHREIGSFDARTYIKKNRNYFLHVPQHHWIWNPASSMQQPCASYGQIAMPRPRCTETHQTRLIKELKDLQAAMRGNQCSSASSATVPRPQRFKRTQSPVSQQASSTEDFHLGAVSVSPVWDSQTSLEDSRALYVPLTVTGNPIKLAYPAAQCLPNGLPCASVYPVSAPSASWEVTRTPSMSLCETNDRFVQGGKGGQYEASGKDLSTLQSTPRMQRVCMFALLAITSFMAGSAAMWINVNKVAAPPSTISVMLDQSKETNSRPLESTSANYFAKKSIIQASRQPRYLDAAREVPRHQWDVDTERKDYEYTNEVSKGDLPTGSAFDFDGYPGEGMADDSLDTPRSKKFTTHS